MVAYLKLVFVFVAIINFTWARPEAGPIDESPSLQSDPVLSDANKEIVPIPTDGVVYGVILNFTSPDHIKSMESTVPVETEETSSPSGEKLVRRKRFLFGLVGSVLRSLNSDNWRECGRTPWGTTIYTNGFATACFGACPEYTYCGYDHYYEYGYGGRYYGTQTNYVHIG